MPLLLVNKEQLIHFQNFEEADLWVRINMVDPNTIIIIPENPEEVEEIEGILDGGLVIEQK